MSNVDEIVHIFMLHYAHNSVGGVSRVYDSLRTHRGWIGLEPTVQQEMRDITPKGLYPAIDKSESRQNIPEICDVYSHEKSAPKIIKFKAPSHLVANFTKPTQS